MQLRSFQLTECGWLVTIYCQGSGWGFYCLPPGCEVLTNNKTYLHSDGAVLAAKRFVETSLARLELGKWLDALKESDRITSDEYADALQLIHRLVRDE